MDGECTEKSLLRILFEVSFLPQSVTRSPAGRTAALTHCSSVVRDGCHPRFRIICAKAFHGVQQSVKISRFVNLGCVSFHEINGFRKQLV